MKKTIDLSLINIWEDKAVYYGADQHWFKNKLHGMSGCGPTTSAMITMYMAAAFPSCSKLYGYGSPVQKSEFVSHMSEVREFVKPGAMGLTDAGYFASSTIDFAKDRGVSLQSAILSNDLESRDAFDKVKNATDDGLMPALLILRNPSVELDDFTWHWMAVTGYDEENDTIFVSTYAREYEIIFARAWVQYKPYHADVVIFSPGE